MNDDVNIIDIIDKLIDEEKQNILDREEILNQYYEEVDEK